MDYRLPTPSCPIRARAGKSPSSPKRPPAPSRYLPNATVLSSGTVSSSASWSARRRRLTRALEGLPLVGSLVQPILLQLYQTPGLNTAPRAAHRCRGRRAVQHPIAPELTTGAPIAFTTKVTSFDGTPISTNFFPASGLQSGQSAPTILEGPGLGSPGITDPESQTGISSVPGLVPGIAPLRDAGYNVVTWDPRGEFDSGGVLQLDSPAFEGKDVSSIIDYVALTARDQADTVISGSGMVGGSYGGGIQLVTAAIDPRIDAIVPGIAWNTLTSSLYPNQTFKTSWATLLTLDLVEAGAQINPQIYSGVLTGDLLGILTRASRPCWPTVAQVPWSATSPPRRC